MKLGSAQRCHRLGPENLHFSEKKGRFSEIGQINAVIMGENTNWEPLLNCSGDFNSLKEDTIYENIVKRGTFCGGTVKMVHVFGILSTLFRVCFAILCSSIGTKMT